MGSNQTPMRERLGGDEGVCFSLCMDKDSEAVERVCHLLEVEKSMLRDGDIDDFQDVKAKNAATL